MLQQLDPADDVVDRASAQRGKVLARLFGDQEQVIDDVLGATLELGAQVFALGRDAGRASVEMALPRHVAAKRHEDAGAESELLGAEQGRYDDVSATTQSPVGAQGDAVAQAVRHKHLLRLREPELPRRARVLDRRERGGSGAAVVSRDEDVVGAGLGDAGRDRPDAGLRDELDADSRSRIHRLQVVDELREVLDRVDVVVRRRRDELHPRLRVAQPRDEARHLDAGQLAAFAWLRALGDLDLELVRALQVARGDAEPRGRDLLHPVVASDAFAVVVGVGVLAALARVGARADCVHRDGEGLVRLGRQRAERHRGADEALHDLARWLDLFQRHRLRTGLQREQLAQRLRRVHAREAPPLAIGVLVARLRGFLGGAHRDGVVGVMLAGLAKANAAVVRDRGGSLTRGLLEVVEVRAADA